MRDFTKYEVWKLSHELTLDIYQICVTFPVTEKYQIISQMQRAVYSVPNNIAEGCGRSSDKEFHRFLQIALGSAHELEYFLILARDLNFLAAVHFEALNIQVNLIKKKLYSLSQKLLK